MNKFNKFTIEGEHHLTPYSTLVFDLGFGKSEQFTLVPMDYSNSMLVKLNGRILCKSAEKPFVVDLLQPYAIRELVEFASKHIKEPTAVYVLSEGKRIPLFEFESGDFILTSLKIKIWHKEESEPENDKAFYHLTHIGNGEIMLISGYYNRFCDERLKSERRAQGIGVLYDDLEAMVYGSGSYKFKVV